jgi:hypothetical protein
MSSSVVIITAWMGGVFIILATLYICLRRSELTAAQALALGIGAALIALSSFNIANVVKETIEKTIRETVQEQLPQIAREVAEKYFRKQNE